MDKHKTYDWTSFTRRIRINKPVPRLYDAWTRPGLMEEWFLEEASFRNPAGQVRANHEHIEKGDRYSWKWHGWQHHAQGEVLAANGEDFLKFSFGRAGVVEVVLRSEGNATEVKLLQKHIPENEQALHDFYYGCSLGWSFWLVNLKAWLECGIVLNEKGMSFDQLQVFEYVNA